MEADLLTIVDTIGTVLAQKIQAVYLHLQPYKFSEAAGWL